MTLSKINVQRLRDSIASEELGFEMSTVLEFNGRSVCSEIAHPPCGTVGCVHGHVMVLMAREGYERFGDETGSTWCGMSINNYSNLITPGGWSSAHLVPRNIQLQVVLDQLDELLANPAMVLGSNWFKERVNGAGFSWN